MQLHQTFTIALLSSVLFACGSDGDGAIDIGSSSGSSTSSDSVSTSTGTDSTETSSVESYFTVDSITPEWISIKGTGGIGRQETSTVTFKLFDENGVVVEFAPVKFSLSGPDGATLNNTTGETDEDGLVNVIIKSGSAAGPVSIKAESVNDPNIFVTSNGLYISTGYPDQDSFSIGVDKTSVPGINHNDATVSVTVNFADADGNNPIPDDTTISFRAEAGRIEDSTTGNVGTCTTSLSKCVMTWTSISDMPDDGKVTILAYALGVESFKDVNPSNGLYDDGETFTDNSEVFLDENLDGIFNDGDEWYQDVDDASGDKDQAYTEGDNKYTGMQCEESSANCDQRFIYIYKQLEITVTSDEQYCVFKDSSGATISSVDLAADPSVTVSVEVSDVNDNTPPTDTVINASTTNGSINGDSSWTVPNSSGGAYTFEVELIKDTNDIDSGNLVIKSVAPSPSTLESKCTLTIND